jgi:outer membrane lipoprotein SlyB
MDLRPRSIARPALAAILLLSACGGSDDSAATTLAPTTTTTLAPTTTQAVTEDQGPAERGDVPRITSEELNERLDDGEEIVVVDTRTSSSYNTGHIVGAILETPGYFDDFPLDQEIVLYCA